MKLHQRLVLSMLAYSITALGVAMAVIAAVGISPYNSMNLSVANLTGIRIGSVTIIFNSLFLITYMMLTGFSERQKYLLQLLALTFFGTMVNFFAYYVFRDIGFDHYIERVGFLVVGTVLGGASVGVNLYLNLITFPVENTCAVLSEKTGRSFLTYRYGLDVVYVTAAIVIAVMNGFDLPVREGTVISMVLFTLSVNTSRNFLMRLGASKTAA